MTFYCNGKNGVCYCDILCADCKFYDDSGGKYVQTNADRIRAMTDDELAVFICDRVDTCSAKRCPGAALCKGADGKANGLKKWLQQPAEVDNAENH